MKRYKLITHLPPKEGTNEPIRMDCVYENFDSVVDVMMRNFNSFMKGLIFPSLHTEIMEADEDDRLGMTFFINDEEVGHNSGYRLDWEEIYGTQTKEYYKKKGMI